MGKGKTGTDTTCAVLFKIEQPESEKLETQPPRQINYAHMVVGQPGVPFTLKAGEPIRDLLANEEVQSYLYQCNWTNGFRDLRLKIDLYHGQVFIKLGHRTGKEVDQLNAGGADEININDVLTDSNLSKDDQDTMKKPEVGGNAIVKLPKSQRGVTKPTTTYIDVKADDPKLLMQSYNFSVHAMANSSYSVTVMPSHRYMRIESGVETLLK